MAKMSEIDRIHLVTACKLAREARCPPKKLGMKVEPLWAALVARGEKALASAVFRPGDPLDAVKNLQFRALDHSQEDLTLYITLEPNASFERLAPTTESIRQLGIKRVVVGTLDPAQRSRGEGNRSLERMGIEVVLADGEEARLCQLLLEDYGRWLGRGLAVLRARVELLFVPGEMLGLRLHPGFSLHTPPDAELRMAGQKNPESSSQSKYRPWQVVLDENGSEKVGEGVILYRDQSLPPLAGARQLPFQGKYPDLGALLRDLSSLGILSVELGPDPGLFRQALRSGLIDSVLAVFPEEEDSLGALARLGQVRYSEGGDPLELRLGGARLLDDQQRYVEAQVEVFH